MKLIVLIFAVVVAVKATEPPKCCLPEKFSMLGSINAAMVTNGKGSIQRMIMNISADYKAEKVGLFIMKGTFPQSWSIFDYKQKIFYRIDPFKRTCIKTKMPISIDNTMGLMHRCVFKNATYVGRAMAGGKMPVDQWDMSGKMKQSGVDIIYNITVTFAAKTCIPIVQSTISSSSLPGITVYQSVVQHIGNFTFKADPALLTPPSYCKSQEVVGRDAPFASLFDF